MGTLKILSDLETGDNPSLEELRYLQPALTGQSTRLERTGRADAFMPGSLEAMTFPEAEELPRCNEPNVESCNVRRTPHPTKQGVEC
jgi:hypothetical protein